VSAFGELAEPNLDVLEVVISALQHPDWGIRQAAEKALSALWRKDPQAVSDAMLSELWRFHKIEDAALAAFANTITRICGQSTISPFDVKIEESEIDKRGWLSLLKHPSPSIRKAVISCLGQWRPFDQEAIRMMLVRALEDEDRTVRDAAYQSLKRHLATAFALPSKQEVI